MLTADDQDQDQDQQQNVLGEGFPRGQLDGVPKTAAVGHLVEIGGIKGQKGEEHDHLQQAPKGELGLEAQKEEYPQQHFHYDQDDGYAQCHGHQKGQVQHPYAEVLLQFEGKSHGVVQFDQATDDEQKAHDDPGNPD